MDSKVPGTLARIFSVGKINLHVHFLNFKF